MYRRSRGVLLGLTVLLFVFIFITPLKAAENTPRITNVTGGQFTVSWQTENACAGKLHLYSGPKMLGNFSDDRGADFRGTTHYITVTGLTENTPYAFATESDGTLDDNGGLYYQVVTGPNIIPVGSIQPAGKVLLADGLTPAAGSIVYISILCPEGPSAPLSTLVDENGYWYIELINARKADCQRLYNVSGEHCNLTVSVESKAGSCTMDGPIMDSEGGKRLYGTIILR